MIRPSLFIAILLAFALQLAPAQAQLSRTFVSAASGNDTNNCDRPTPCRSFQGAHDKTNPDGEITVLDPGGYGAVTITKSISIVDDGVGEASVLVSGGVTGITITAGAASYVNLRGITIQGIGFGGGTGLVFNSGFSLTMSNCVVRNLTHDGIVFAPNAPSGSANLAVSNTLVADNGGNGINVQPAGAIFRVNVVLNRVEAYQNSGAGILADGSASPMSTEIWVNAMGSTSGNNGGAGFATRTAAGRASPSMQVLGSQSVTNGGFGLEANGGGILVGQSGVIANQAGQATGFVVSYGDNYSEGGHFPFTIGKF